MLWLMEWPALSYDLNLIKLLWEELDGKVEERCLSSFANLQEVLRDTLQSISEECLENLNVYFTESIIRWATGQWLQNEF